MFEFITKTSNPLGGCCEYSCYGGGCWAQRMIKHYGLAKYRGSAVLDVKVLEQSFGVEDYVFLCDMNDLFGSWVPSDIIRRVLSAIRKSKAQFLLLTKNPRRYLDFQIPANCVCGATVESDVNWKVSGAPAPLSRLSDLELLKSKKMISIEPIQEFNLEVFVAKILKAHPEFIAIGLDNYGCQLPEPSLEKTLELIKRLEGAGIKVYRKTIRKAWNEK